MENSYQTWLQEIQILGDYIYNYANRDNQNNPRGLINKWFFGESWGDMVVSVGTKDLLQLNFNDTWGNYFYLRLVDTIQYEKVDGGEYSSCGTSAFDLVMPFKLVLIMKGYDTGYIEHLFCEAISSNECSELEWFEPSTAYNYITEIPKSTPKETNKLNKDINILSFKFDHKLRRNPRNNFNYCDIPICEPCEIGQPYGYIDRIDDEDQLKSKPIK